MFVVCLFWTEVLLLPNLGKLGGVMDLNWWASGRDVFGDRNSSSFHYNVCNMMYVASYSNHYKLLCCKCKWTGKDKNEMQITFATKSSQLRPWHVYRKLGVANWRCYPRLLLPWLSPSFMMALVSCNLC